jgi:hypothetical protein
MATTVTELQKALATYIDQSNDAPTEGGDDWTLRLAFVNRAQQTWADSYDWNELYTEVFSRTSQATGNASISLPTDFPQVSH